MPTITAHMRDDHRRCDDLFVEAERLAARGESAAARAAQEAFSHAMARHFAMEEEVLFPAFETVMGPAAGPTAVMRHEHGQMRELFAAMGAALGRGDAEEFLAASETLLVLMQQHNAKEEQILYPMIDRVISDTATLVARMERLDPDDRHA